MNSEQNYYTEERTHDDLNYHRAQSITLQLYHSGLITEEEFNILTEINRETFLPLFVEIYPELLDKSSKQSDV